MFQYILRMNVWDAYNQVDEIGTGSYGKMLKVQNKLNQQIFAAKLLQFEIKSKEYEQVIKEISTLQQKYQHPNLIQVYEVFQWQDLQGSKNSSSPNNNSNSKNDKSNIYNFALIIEHCDFCLEKFQYQDQNKFMRLYPKHSQTVQYLEQAVQALDYLAKQGIYHKDIRPHNIMLKNDTLKIKCRDYGISEKIFKQNLKESVVAQKEYQAPEILQNSLQEDSKLTQEQEEKADIYSLGMTFFVIAANKSQNELKNLNLQNDEQQMNQTIDEDIQDDPELKQMLKKMLRINPEERYANFAEIQQEINQYNINQAYQKNSRTFLKRKFSPMTMGLLCLGLFLLGLILFLMGVWTAITVNQANSSPNSPSDQNSLGQQFKQFPAYYSSCNSVYQKNLCFQQMTLDDWTPDMQFKTAIQSATDFNQLNDQFNKYRRQDDYWNCMKSVIDLCKSLPADFPPPFQCINGQYLQKQCNDIMTNTDYANDQKFRSDVKQNQLQDYGQLYNQAYKNQVFGTATKTNYFQCVEKSVFSCDSCHINQGEAYVAQKFISDDLNSLYASLSCQNYASTETQKQYDCLIKKFEKNNSDCDTLGKYVDDNSFFFNVNDNYIKCFKRAILSCKSE